MAARPIVLDGVTVLIDVDEGDAAAPGAPAGLVERGEVVNRVRDVGADLRGLLGAITRPLRQALDESQPDAWSIELNLGFKGEAGIPCITKGEANASVKVTVSWKKQTVAAA